MNIQNIIRIFCIASRFVSQINVKREREREREKERERERMAQAGVEDIKN